MSAFHDNGHFKLLLQHTDGATRIHPNQIEQISQQDYQRVQSQAISKDDSIYVEVTKGIYGLPQAGLLANNLLEKRLNKHGYYQSKLVPGLWKYDMNGD